MHRDVGTGYYSGQIWTKLKYLQRDKVKVYQKNFFYIRKYFSYKTSQENREKPNCVSHRKKKDKKPNTLFPLCVCAPINNVCCYVLQ